jgi:hypothetical protein
LEGFGSFTKFGLTLIGRKEREIEDVLANIGATPMDKIRKIGNPCRIHFFARQKDIQD